MYVTTCLVLIKVITASNGSNLSRLAKLLFEFVTGTVAAVTVGAGKTFNGVLGVSFCVLQAKLKSRRIHFINK